jgi:cbb3-type cytochrome oxidase maturation protein
MEVLYLVIPITLVLVTVIIAFLWWSSRSGQYDDMDGPAWKILMDDDTPKDEEPTTKSDNATPKH